MKIAGVIAEYNPFHCGHEYHLRCAREITGCDYLVVCMVGSMTQRGEAACVDKWTRTRIALECGADAVFELPALFAVRTADAFAHGGVSILNGIGCDALSFGCETDDMNLLNRITDLREKEPSEVSAAVRANLASGMTQAQAQGRAWADYLRVDGLNAPNTVLAAEYLRAMRDLGSKMEPIPVLRRGGYHDDILHDKNIVDGGFASAATVCASGERHTHISDSGFASASAMCASGERHTHVSDDGFASASAIRAAMRSGEDWHMHVPEAARVTADRMHDPDDLLLNTLRRMTAAEIAALPDVSEGLEHRVKRCAELSATAEELIDGIKCRRYTRARIQRLCAHALLGLTADLARQHPLPEYARLIGMRSDALPLFAEIKARATLPVISDAAKLADSEIFQTECRATDLRALLCDEPEKRRAGQEFTRKFVRV